MDETKGTSPKDVFLHLFSIITLYISLISLGALVFQIINIYFPDLLDFNRSPRSTVRWPLAVLTVIFPLYLWANSFLQKDIVKYPEKRELKTRKWLLYFTLFIAAGVVAGDLVALIFRYLGGEVTIRFVLKVLVVLILAASAFLYYGWNVKKDILATKDKRMNIFVKAVVGITFIFIILGYVLAGSPQAERLRRFDEKRTSDLQQIQFQIIDFWRAKEKLPSSLDDLRDELRFIPPKDPETDQSYEYRQISELSFELCATFKASNKDKESLLGGEPVSMRQFPEETWFHDEGRHCFQRTIDPQFYPPYQKELIPQK